MTYEMRIERMLDAPAELVFDTMLDPAFKDEIYTDLVEGWSARRFEVDLRVGGTWRTEFGPRDSDGEEIGVVTNVFTAIDRPQRLAYNTSMYVSAWGRTVDWIEEVTLEEHDGKTLLTVRAEFETQADRDAFEGGTPEYLDALQRVVERRVREGVR
jgi:uncharacterized protein YndB with AHSA1/START domain